MKHTTHFIVVLVVLAFAAFGCASSEEGSAEDVGEVSSALCRALKPGDPYYPEYVHCCDKGNGQSEWTNSFGLTSTFEGNCNSWGIY